jgi:DNA-binding PadR family transcriptional regulator
VYDLTGFQRDLLYVVKRLDDPSGIDIKEELESYYSDPINHGRLYPNLDTLVEKGLVRKRQKNRRTNGYGLTARGRREVRARREWENQYVSFDNGNEEGEDDEAENSDDSTAATTNSYRGP